MKTAMSHSWESPVAIRHSWKSPVAMRHSWKSPITFSSYKHPTRVFVRWARKQKCKSSTRGYAWGHVTVVNQLSYGVLEQHGKSKQVIVYVSRHFRGSENMLTKNSYLNSSGRPILTFVPLIRFVSTDITIRMR